MIDFDANLGKMTSMWQPVQDKIMANAKAQLELEAKHQKEKAILKTQHVELAKEFLPLSFRNLFVKHPDLVAFTWQAYQSTNGSGKVKVLKAKYADREVPLRDYLHEHIDGYPTTQAEKEVFQEIREIFAQIKFYAIREFTDEITTSRKRILITNRTGTHEKN